jgi:hypothetical protein
MMQQMRLLSRFFSQPEKYHDDIVVDCYLSKINIEKHGVFLNKRRRKKRTAV